MPTPPHEHILPQDDPHKDIEPIIVEIADKIDEVKHFGSYVMSWIAKAPPDDPLRLAPLLLLRHTIEVIDAISILIRQRSVDPAKILLRSLLETWFYIRFITESDSDQRSAAYMVWYFHNRQKRFQRLHPDLEVGKQYRASLARDEMKLGSLLDGLDVAEIEKAISNIDAILKQPEYVTMEATYQTMMSDKKTRPRSWYHLAGGPTDIEGLANHLRSIAVYEEHYRSFSGAAHASDILYGVVSGSKERPGAAAFKQIRLLNNLPQVAHNSIMWANSVFRHMIDRYDPRHRSEIRRWYAKEIREFVMVKLPRLKIKYDN